MKYACLVYVDRAIIGTLSAEANTKLANESIDYDWDLEKRGRLIMAQPLDEPETAVTIRVRSGRMSSTDGPFAETKEHLGGFFLIEARDLAEAIEIARTSPMAEMGSIEVRPLMQQTHTETGKQHPGA